MCFYLFQIKKETKALFPDYVSSMNEPCEDEILQETIYRKNIYIIYIILYMYICKYILFSSLFQIKKETKAPVPEYVASMKDPSEE